MTISSKNLFILLVVIILLTGLYFYKTSSKFNLENFNGEDLLLYPAPINFVIVSVSSNNVQISFNPPPQPTETDGMVPSPIPILQSYMIVLVGLDNTGTPIGTKRILVKQPNTCSTQSTINLTLPENQRLNCNYTIPIIPENGEVSYKIGVIAIYDTGISNVSSNTQSGYFQLSSESQTTSDKDNVLATAGGSYEVLMKQLGGFPDNLYIAQEIGSNSLSNLITKQLALGVVNVNLNNMLPSTTS